jgi:hypothetical protein
MTVSRLTVRNMTFQSVAFDREWGHPSIVWPWHLRAHANRHAAAPTFWTLEPRGWANGAIAGWRDVLVLTLDAAALDVVIWPCLGRPNDFSRRARR